MVCYEIIDIDSSKNIDIKLSGMKDEGERQRGGGWLER